MDAEIKTSIDELTAYNIRTDARLLALQSEISKLFGHNEEQREAFDDSIHETFLNVYQQMADSAKQYDAELSAKLSSEILKMQNKRKDRLG